MEILHHLNSSAKTIFRKLDLLTGMMMTLVLFLQVKEVMYSFGISLTMLKVNQDSLIRISIKEMLVTLVLSIFQEEVRRPIVSVMMVKSGIPT
jgi:hypothetical protein